MLLFCLLFLGCMQENNLNAIKIKDSVHIYRMSLSSAMKLWE